MADQVGVDKTRQTITFEFGRSGLFRFVHADGVFGGVTPSGYLMASFFSQTSPVPESITHELNPDSTLGDVVSRQSNAKGMIHRELEVGIIMDLALAKSLQDWLKEKIETMEKKA